MRTLDVIRRRILVVVLGILPMSIGFVPEAFAQGPTSRADFNADGFDDLAVGSPGRNGGAGGVHILFGSDRWW
jgi:hypothetical protein